MILNPKKVTPSYPPMVFPKMCFNIIISHAFSENLIEIPQVIQKIWRFSPSILTNLCFFGFFEHFLVAKKLMTSAYNR